MKPGQFRISYYSDNLYIDFCDESGVIHHLSLDAEKMEASHTRDSLMAMREIFETNAGITNSKLLRVTRFLHREMVLKPVGLLGQNLVPFPGLPSGVAGTSTCNSFLMRMVVVHLYNWLTII